MCLPQFLNAKTIFRGKYYKRSEASIFCIPNWIKKTDLFHGAQKVHSKENGYVSF